MQHCERNLCPPLPECQSKHQAVITARDHLDALAKEAAISTAPRRRTNHWEPAPYFDAPGAPGILPTWTSSSKDVVGCSLGPARLWFTAGYGIINEVYWPRIDIPQIRDLGFIVADDRGFWIEVKRMGQYQLRSVAPGVPAYEITHSHSRFSLRLRITPDPLRDVLLIECRLESDDPALRIYVLVAPHLGATGYSNRAVIAEHRGRRFLSAERAPFAMALAAVDEHQQDAVTRASAGYVGASDGWQDFAGNGRMAWEYPAAGPGNVALLAELQPFSVLALAFASSQGAAATLAVSSLMQPFDSVLDAQIADWSAWHRSCAECCARPAGAPAHLQDQFVTSVMVLRTHLDKTYPGAMVASLSVPWGDTGNERSGYHLVWPRDLVECATALLAFGGEAEARNTLRYLIATQNVEGHWQQNQWLGGEPYWRGVQLDEAAYPVVLAALLADRDALGGTEPHDMIRRALGYIARVGPSTDQDRWEENSGLNAFTLATCIAALVAGGSLLEPMARHWATALADFWNAHLEDWLTACGTDLAKQFAIAGYYVRTSPPSVLSEGQTALDEHVPIRNRSDGMRMRASEQVSTDFLRLVRYGLRDASDPLVLDTIKVMDRLLKVETPSGSFWHRYNGDGYGEHDDGRPYDGAGRGRPWPLLAGERGHYALSADEDPLPMLETMAASASPGGMIPEQVWDASPIQERRLHPGRPTGSAMPLAWAHAEFVKLAVSRNHGRPFDRPEAVWNRYGGRKKTSAYAFWWPHAQIRSIIAGCRLVIALPRAGMVHWGVNGWREVSDLEALDSSLGFWVAELDTGRMNKGESIDFTIRWQEGGWERIDHRIEVVSARENM